MREIPDRIAKSFSFSSLRVRLQMLVWVAIMPALQQSDKAYIAQRKKAEIVLK